MSEHLLGSCGSQGKRKQRLEAEDGIFEEICGNRSRLSPSSSLHLPLPAHHDRPARGDEGQQRLNETNSRGADRERRQQSGLCEAGVVFNLMVSLSFSG